MQSFDWDGRHYDQVAEPQSRWGKTVVDRLELAGDETVLDAGCGSGRVTEELLGRLPSGRVVAVDASASMLEAAADRLAGYASRVTFLRSDLLSLTPDQLGSHWPVDAVLSTATFHWITDHDALFRRLAACIRPGGALVAQFGGEGNIERVIQAVRSLGAERAGLWHYPSPEQTTQRLRLAGFTEITAWLQPEPTPFPLREDLIDFLETVCLREHVAGLPAAERRAFTAEVADALPGRTIDYVRLNVSARRP